jgi:C-terminal processing protease CtpA/Prc
LFRTLDPQHGREVYLLGLCSEEPARALTVRLRSTSGQKRERTLPLHRNRMADYKPDRSSVFTYTVQPFPILQVTTFDIKGSMPSVRQKLEEFETTGSRPELRNSPYVLVDVRGNGGGQDIPGPTWLDALTDEPTKTCFVDRLRSPLVYEAMLNMELSRHAKVGGGTKDSFEAFRSAFLRGEVPPAERDYAVDRRQWNASESHVRQSSKVPSHFAGMLLVLYDAKTGSAAENFIQQARQLERAVTLGENSAGMCNFGDCISYYLPNSTVRFQCGHKLIRDETGEMREGIGYLPDYWFDDPDPLGLIVKNVVLLKPHPGD